MFRFVIGTVVAIVALGSGVAVAGIAGIAPKMVKLIESGVKAGEGIDALRLYSGKFGFASGSPE